MSSREDARARTAQLMFEEWAEGYDTTIKVEFEKNSGATYEQYMAELLAVVELPEGGEVLDAATGTGIVAVAVALALGERVRVVGVDVSEGMLEVAARNVARAGVSERVSLLRSSVEALPFEDGTFDLVNCSLALHHTDIPRALAELRRVLRPGGRLVISDFVAPPTWLTPLGRLAVPLYRFAMRFSSDEMIRAEVGYAAIHPEPAWSRLLAEVGLELQELRTYPKADVRQWEPVPFLLVSS